MAGLEAAPILRYTGQPRTTAAEPYLPGPELVEAVNLTILLAKRPLLITGDPGSGKTRLARAVASELDLAYEEWPIKSTSRARDGLYTFDAIARLRDTQMLREHAPAVLKEIGDYVRLGPLGRAFANPGRTVVLIDEIDKADIDFPNDLLLELDEQRFVVDETGETIAAQESPIVFVTSNDEKDLPDAFLRRCLFYYIEFPDQQQLINIVAAHFPRANAALVQAAVKRFRTLRRQMEADKGKAGKRVSTSELIDWFEVLWRHPHDQILAQLNGQLPYPAVLLKSWEDHLRYLGAPPANAADD